MTPPTLTTLLVSAAVVIGALLTLVVSYHRALRSTQAHLAKFTGPRERHPVTKRFVSAKKGAA